jgi:phage I-like protein
LTTPGNLFHASAVQHPYQDLLDGVRVELAADDPAAPKWCKMFPLGVVKYRADFPKGIRFDAATLQTMATNYAAEGKPERAVNYFHRGASTPGDPTPISEKIAAGWIQDLELRDDGLYALIKWTDRARGYILADELRYLSPEFRLSFTNKTTGANQGPTLLGAALLNDPYLTELPRVAANEAAPTADGANMEKLRKLLNLSDSATEADIEAAVTKLAEGAKCAECGSGMSCPKCDKAMSEQATKLSESTAKLAEIEGVVTKLTEQVSALEAEKAKLLSERRESEVKLFVDGLVKTGKVTPAIREDVERMGLAGGVDAIKFFEKAAPVVVPGAEIGVTGDATAKNQREEAQKRFLARRDELQAKGLSFTDAHNQTKSELPKEFALYFSNT